MKALILNNKVVQLAEKEFEVHENLTWVDCDDSVKVGWSYKDKKFTDPDALTTDEQAAAELQKLRENRNKKLQETDHLALSDQTLTDDMKTYRQALRDITKTYQSMDDDGFKWPTKP